MSKTRNPYGELGESSTLLLIGIRNCPVNRDRTRLCRIPLFLTFVHCIADVVPVRGTVCSIVGIGGW